MKIEQQQTVEPALKVQMELENGRCTPRSIQEETDDFSRAR